MNYIKLLQVFQLFLLPSFHEGLPLVAVEAQAAGVPVLLSDIITKEVALTPLVRYLDGADRDQWVEAIVNHKAEKYNFSEEIREQGFDIATSSKWLENFYLSIDRRGEG